MVGDGVKELLVLYPVGPAEMAAHALELRDLGIDVIGSCCGSSPEHTRAIAEALTAG